MADILLDLIGMGLAGTLGVLLEMRPRQTPVRTSGKDKTHGA